MRGTGIGWRSARSTLTNHILPADVIARIAPAPAGAPGAMHATAGSEQPLWPWVGVTWSLAFISFLLYLFAITTYALPIASAMMTVGLVALPFQRVKFRFPAWLAILTAFLAWCGITYFQSNFGEASWQGLVLLFKLWLVSIVAVNVLRTPARLRLFAIVFLGCFALWPVRGALFNYYIYGQKYWGRAIWQFAYGNPNDLGAYCLLQLSLAAAVLVKETNVWIRRAALVGLGLLPVLVFLTQSRGAMIAMLLFGAFAIAGHKRELAAVFGTKFRRRIFGALAVVAVLTVVIAPSSVWHRLSGLTKATSASTLREVDDTRSAEQRYEIWRVATRMIQDNPLMGVGIGAYPYAHQYTVRWETRNWFAGGQRDAHSTYLLVMAETGVPGFALFAAMIVSVLLYAKRVRRRARDVLPAESLQIYYLQAGLLAFLLAGLFGTFAYLHLLYIHLALVWAWAAETQSRIQQGVVAPVTAPAGRRQRGGLAVAAGAQ